MSGNAGVIVYSDGGIVVVTPSFVRWSTIDVSRTFETRSASICSEAPGVRSRTGAPLVTSWPFANTVLMEPCFQGAPRHAGPLWVSYMRLPAGGWAFARGAP